MILGDYTPLKKKTKKTVGWVRPSRKKNGRLFIRTRIKRKKEKEKTKKDAQLTFENGNLSMRGT
jgi:hypothetical protein